MRVDLPRYSSSIGKLKVHVGIKAKYCHKIFNDVAVRTRCNELFVGAFSEMGISVDAIGFDEEHCHLVFDLSPRYALWQVMKKLKGRSSRMLLQEFPYLRKEFFWGGHLWNPSYYLDSIGKDEQTIVNYANNQKYGKNNSVAPDVHQCKLTQFMPPTSVGGSLQDFHRAAMPAAVWGSMFYKVREALFFLQHAKK